MWLVNDVHWEDISLLTHDDERLPVPRVQQQFQLFQLSVGVPVRDEAGGVVGVMMLYRARHKGQQHGYGRTGHLQFEAAKGDAALSQVLRAAAGCMATAVKMQKEQEELTALLSGTDQVWRKGWQACLVHSMRIEGLDQWWWQMWGSGIGGGGAG